MRRAACFGYDSAVVGVLTMGLQFGGVYAAFALGASAGLSALVIGTMPLSVALGSWLLGERIAPRQWLGFVLGVGGDAERSAGMVRAMLNHLAITHGPDRLRFAVVADTPDGGRWEYLKWLPQVQHPSLIDALGSRRMIYGNWTEFLDELAGSEE